MVFSNSMHFSTILAQTQQNAKNCFHAHFCYRLMLKMPVPQAKRAKWMQKLNKDTDVLFKFPSLTAEYFTCTFCEMFLVTQYLTLTQHLGTKLQKTNKELKKSRKKTASQVTLEEVTGRTRPKSQSEVMVKELCQTLLAANIPLNKMENPHLRNFMEKYISKIVPTQSWLRQKYLAACYNDVMGDIKEKLKEGSLWVFANCAQDAVG